MQPDIASRQFPRATKMPLQQLLPRGNPLGQLLGIFFVLHSLTDSITAIDLLDKLLQFDPARRLTCEVALRHPYFQSSNSSNSASSNNSAQTTPQSSNPSSNAQYQQMIQAQYLEQQRRTAAMQGGVGSGGSGGGSGRGGYGFEYGQGTGSYNG
jgi:negative regulator of the PHO system